MPKKIMEEIEKFGYGLVFGSIAYSITNRKIDFSKTALIYLDEAKKFFGNVLKSLESIVDEKEYFIVEDLCQIIKIAGYKCSNPSKKDIKNMADGFKNLIGQLDRLRQNPKRFHNSQNADKLSIICEKIRDFYATYYQIF